MTVDVDVNFGCINAVGTAFSCIIEGRIVALLYQSDVEVGWDSPEMHDAEVMPPMWNLVLVDDPDHHHGLVAEPMSGRMTQRQLEANHQRAMDEACQLAFLCSETEPGPDRRAAIDQYQRRLYAESR